MGAACVWATTLAPGAGWAGADALHRGFLSPPATARPFVWWHWMDGQIDEDAIDKDLAWFKRVGLGGVQNFDAGMRTPQVAKTRLPYMSPGWKHAFRHAVKTADRLGLSYGVAASPGWSETGGPWVPAADAMKKVVWSATTVDGGRLVDLALPPLPSVNGPFQDEPILDSRRPDLPRLSRDTRVLAIPAPALDREDAPAVTVSGYPVDGSALAGPTGGAPGFSVPVGTPEQPTDVTLRFAQPRTVRSAVLFMRGVWRPFQAPRFEPTLEARVDGGWRRLATFSVDPAPSTVSFPAVTSDAFRVVLRPATRRLRPVIDDPAPGVDVPPDPAETSRSVEVTRFAVSGEARVDRFEMKAGFAAPLDYDALPAPADDAAAVAPARVVDLTASLHDGRLRATLPPGRWRILRMGWSLLGTTNAPAPPEATGFEVDKYDPGAVARYMRAYLATYRAATGPDLFGRRGLRTLVTDSTEAGNANWTPDIAAQFTRLRGYDPTPFLPALTGVIVGSRALSDGFLYDWRRTLAERLAEAHYGVVASEAHAQGLTVFGEALEAGRPQLGDDLAMRSHADVPMAALWAFDPKIGPNPSYIGDMRGAASVAHVYGRPYVAAEMFTAGLASYAFSPADLKRVIDTAFAAGVNRPVIHSSVHQPTDDKQPGLTLSVFGQYFNRHETWAEYARPWIDYIARSSFLLQQGVDVADVAIFTGEEAPVTALTMTGGIGPTPRDNGFDYLDADMLARLSVREGRLVSPGGARYRALYLGGSSRRMTLPTLRALARLVDAGATVIGSAPEGTPSAADDRRAFAALRDRLWAAPAGGADRVIAGADLEAELKRAGVAPDLRTDAPAGVVAFVHRRTPEAEIYFVRSSDARARRVRLDVGVAGRAPELWRADDGSVAALPHHEAGGRTTLDLDLQPEDAVFVVFPRRPTPGRASAPPGPETASLDLGSGWTRSLRDPACGAPVKVEALGSWTRADDPCVRYFSGVADYTRTVDVPAALARASTLRLDLGGVGDLARVTVNGQVVGTAWRAPFTVDVTGRMRPGANTVRIEVANLWVNRLIGDAQPAAKPTTFTTALPYRADAPLRPSGLLGPVRLVTLAR